MLNYSTFFVRDGMTDAEIYDSIDKSGALMVFDARTGVITKTINDIIRCEYARRKKEKLNEQKQTAQLIKSGLQTTPLPDTKHRPDAIKIGD